MKHLLHILLTASLLDGGASLMNGAEAQLTLATPRIISLQTSLSPTGGTVQVEIQVSYDLAGKAACTATVDGDVAGCAAKIAARVMQPNYTFTLKQVLYRFQYHSANRYHCCAWFTDLLKAAAFTALDEDAILVAVFKTYHAE